MPILLGLFDFPVAVINWHPVIAFLCLANMANARERHMRQGDQVTIIGEARKAFDRTSAAIFESTS